MNYSSKPKHKSDGKSKEKKYCQLAIDSFNAFQPFINVYDCGLKGFDGPFHLITKEDWRLFRRYKAGERNLRYARGGKFNSYLAINCNVFSPRHVHDHIQQHKPTYYTSGKRGLGLLYLDIDTHHPWQTDEYRAKEVLQEVFPDAYFRASWRGQNGYVKVRYQTIEQFNALARSLQKTLGRLFLQRGILCDIEVKGTITHNNKSGSLGKLPFENKCPCNMRDESDSWNYPQLRKFQACPIINARYVQHIASGLEAKLDDGWIALFAEEKQLLKDKERQEQQEIAQKEAAKMATSAVPAQPAPQPAPVQPPVQSAPLTRKPLVRSLPTTIHISLPVAKSEDAFTRNQDDIRRFVRAFWKEHRQFPTTDETLDWLKVNNRYSGEWSERQNGRARRIEQILAFTERGFDPQKISQGKHEPVTLKRNQFAWWVRQQVGSVMTSSKTNIRAFDHDTMTAPTTTVSVPAKFVETFMAVVHFCVQQDPLHNQAVPTNRIKQLWTMVEDGAAWNQQYYQIVRERLNRMGVIKIVDRQHASGKAWRWEAGDRFPAEDYRTEQRKLRERSRIQTGVVGSYRDLVAGDTSIRNWNLHNTLYHDAATISGLLLDTAEGRAPP